MFPPIVRFDSVHLLGVFSWGGLSPAGWTLGFEVFSFLSFEIFPFVFSPFCKSISAHSTAVRRSYFYGRRWAVVCPKPLVKSSGPAADFGVEGKASHNTHEQQAVPLE